MILLRGSAGLINYGHESTATYLVEGDIIEVMVIAIRAIAPSGTNKRMTKIQAKTCQKVFSVFIKFSCKYKKGFLLRV